MADDCKNKAAGEDSTLDDEVERSLEEAAEAAKRPHEDAEERRRRREAAARVERTPIANRSRQSRRAGCPDDLDDPRTAQSASPGLRRL
jgi:hypothetical protein